MILKKFFGFWFILILFSLLQGQQINIKSNFGVKVGVNSASLSGESTKNNQVRETDIQARLGFYVGGFYFIEINRKFNLQPSLMLSYQGATIDISRWEGVPVTAGSEVDLPYILLPVMWQYKPTNKLVLEIGPQLGYNLGKFITIKGKIVLNDQTIDLEERLEDVARWDFSVLAGVGYEIFDNMTTKLSFAQGLNSLDQRKNDAFILHHRVMSLGLEYKL